MREKEGRRKDTSNRNSTDSYSHSHGNGNGNGNGKDRRKDKAVNIVCDVDLGGVILTVDMSMSLCP